MHISTCSCSTRAPRLSPSSLVRTHGAVFGKKIICRDRVRKSDVSGEVGYVEGSPRKIRIEETRIICGDEEIRGLRKEKFDVAVTTGSWMRLWFGVRGQWRSSAQKRMEGKGPDADVGDREGEIGLDPVKIGGFSGIGIDLGDRIRHCLS